jgi:hypothetical protein
MGFAKLPSEHGPKPCGSWFAISLVPSVDRVCGIGKIAKSSSAAALHRRN